MLSWKFPWNFFRANLLSHYIYLQITDQKVLENKLIFYIVKS